MSGFAETRQVKGDDMKFLRQKPDQIVPEERTLFTDPMHQDDGPLVALPGFTEIGPALKTGSRAYLSEITGAADAAIAAASTAGADARHRDKTANPEKNSRLIRLIPVFMGVNR